MSMSLFMKALMMETRWSAESRFIFEDNGSFAKPFDPFGLYMQLS